MPIVNLYSPTSTFSRTKNPGVTAGVFKEVKVVMTTLSRSTWTSGRGVGSIKVSLSVLKKLIVIVSKVSGTGRPVTSERTPAPL